MTSHASRRLRTPRAAALAGVIFALLLGTAYVMIRVSIPQDQGDREWLDERSGYIRFALGLVPFAGIAFLWFMGVVRDRIGDYEDRFFSTVYLGSGILFLAMVFVSTAAAGSLLATYASVAEEIFDSGVYFYARDVVYQISNIFSVRMAAVFMFSLGTVGLRTGAMPVWLGVGTYILAAGLLLVISYSLWISLVFPVWVLVVSMYFLIANRRSGPIIEVPGNDG